ncbi:MAG: phosphoribosylamine--glycine ligase, partial [Desulfobacterales bacterium]|nr:phosphoribosylamine--glycine ligase [Desulfobacterales bacterium]
MKVLVVGSGGREHALVWKLAQSPRVDNIFCAPGNAGISEIATCVDIAADNIPALLDFAEKESMDFTVVGPEAPLAAGIVDTFEKKGLKVFGASKKAAQLEASKAFSKKIMNRYGIPTATGRSFTSFEPAAKYMAQFDGKVVVKADGLAAGKGVIVCSTPKEADTALKEIMEDKAFGDAGARVVIEERLEGEEVSFLALTDGKTVLPLPTSQDHKRAHDGDKGLNTGGMGAYSPAPIIDKYMHDKIMKEVMIPTVEGMAKEGIPYKGILYAGLMIDRDRIKVLEFNARFGDPECQPLMMRVKNDLLGLMEATIDGTLAQHTIDIDERAAVCVVMASGGYPGSYRKGNVIKGLDEAKANDLEVFHAGTSLRGNKVTTSGGRVLGVTALGADVKRAINKAYKSVEKISWTKAFHRTDIGGRALAHMATPARVGIIMGSDSDYETMKGATEILRKFGVPYEFMVASAHRTPFVAADFAIKAREKGLRVIIAAAGHAAHLAGVMAAHTTLPVIGVPVDSSALSGMDALLSTVQMPPGVPVAT